MGPHLTNEQLEEILQGETRGAEAPIAASQKADIARTHLAICETCQLRLELREAIVQEWALLVQHRSGKRRSDCPPEDVWIEIAAGIFEGTSETYLDHALKCDYCGPLLKTAADTVDSHSSPNEDSFLESLSSAAPGWQRSMAHTLAATGKGRGEKGASHGLTAIFAWPRVAFAAVTLVLAATGAWLALRTLRPPSVDQLLAQAYAEKRTVDVRITGAKYSPVRVEREESGSVLENPSSLLKAEVLIAENLKAHPDDPVWLDKRGRAELLDGNDDDAINSLQRGLVFDPNSFPLLADLGAAYLMRAESGITPKDNSDAIDALGKAHKLRPNDPDVLFNLALACERILCNQGAKQLWQEYLKLDPKGDWAAEAREHLNRLNQTSEQHQRLTQTPLLGPSEFSAAAASSSGSARELGSRAELYLVLAFASWLPDALPKGLGSPSARNSLRAVESLSQILKNEHGDPWLADLLARPRTSDLADAISEVLASNNAVLTGQYSLALDLANRSRRHFEKGANRPGVLWARLAAMTAHDSALRFSDCLADGADNDFEMTESAYRWLQAAFLVERADCLSGLARIREAIDSNRKGREIAERFRYPAIRLRAIAFGATYMLSAGDQNEAMRELLSALRTYWESDLPDAVGENLYASIVSPSESIDWPFVDVYALEEMLTSFPPRDPVDRAVEWELLGQAEMRAGEYSVARADLQNAAQALNSVPNDPAVALRRAQIAVNDAQILLELNDVNRAKARLAPFRQQFENANPGRFQAEFFKALGEAYLRSGDDISAEPLIERAMATRETGLENLTREADKLTWGRARSEVYRDLLEIKLKQNTPEEAFAWWEWYKAASLRSSDAGASYSPAEAARVAIGQATALVDSVPPGTALISYASLRDSVVAFVVRAGVVRVHRLPADSELGSLTRRFLILCSDPSTDISMLDLEGHELYRMLVEPLEYEIQNVQLLRIETDGDIARVPFSVLRTGDNGYLGDKVNLSYSQGISFGLHYTARAIARRLSPVSTALVVASQGGGDSSLPVLPDVVQEGSEVASHFRQPAFFSGPAVKRREVLEFLKTAEIFHFAGHELNIASQTGLVLGPGDYLTARDIAGLRPIYLQLAVLSSCDSAIGDEGTIADIESLARTLTALGVPHVVASRWRVDSAVTRQWMDVFYSNLISGRTPAESLTAADMAIRKDPHLLHPYYWASFAVFGNS